MDLTHALSLAVPLVFDAEGCKLVSYLDTLAKPPVWTIGHGNTWVNGRPVQYGMTCSRAEADLWGCVTLTTTAQAVRGLLKLQITNPQWAACISLAYNIGIAGFASSTVLEAVNLALTQRAAEHFLEYNHAGGHVVPGLTARRMRERALFLSGIESGGGQPVAPPAAPTPAPLSEADLLNQQQIDRNKPMNT
jgi:lysozyme